MISDKYKCVFVHIPKTAGSSIEHALHDDQNLKKRISSDHSTLADYYARSPSRCSRYFRFTFVRNPWDRIFSVFNYYITGGNGQKHDLAIAREMPQDFTEFCHKTIAAKSYVFFDCNALLPQSEFINHELKVNFVGRFENLAADYCWLQNKLGLKAQLPHTRKRKHKRYQQAYDVDCIDIVAAKYASDIDKFGYMFE